MKEGEEDPAGRYWGTLHGALWAEVRILAFPMRVMGSHGGV